MESYRKQKNFKSKSVVYPLTFNMTSATRQNPTTFPSRSSCTSLAISRTMAAMRRKNRCQESHASYILISLQISANIRKSMMNKSTINQVIWFHALQASIGHQSMRNQKHEGKHVSMVHEPNKLANVCKRNKHDNMMKYGNQPAILAKRPRVMCRRHHEIWPSGVITDLLVASAIVTNASSIPHKNPPTY